MPVCSAMSDFVKSNPSLSNRKSQTFIFGVFPNNLSDLIRAVPSHLRGMAKKEIEMLFKQGFVNRKPGIKGEFRYSLRSELKDKVNEILERGYY